MEFAKVAQHMSHVSILARGSIDTFNVSKESDNTFQSTIRDSIEEQFSKGDDFWFGEVLGKVFLCFELKNIDEWYVLVNNNNLSLDNIRMYSARVFNSALLPMSGITHSPKTLFELYSSTHEDMLELCNSILHGAIESIRESIRSQTLVE